MPRSVPALLYRYSLLLLLALGCVNGCKNAQVTPAPGRDNALSLGNPSNAATDPDNYLLEKPQYTLSYNCSRGTANWISWHHAPTCLLCNQNHILICHLLQTHE